MFIDFLMIFVLLFFFDFSLGKGMQIRKVDFVKIVLPCRRERVFEGLQGYKTCSKTIQMDIKLYANSSMRFGSDF